MPARSFNALCCSILLLFAANTAGARDGGDDQGWDSMQRNIAKACEQNPYGPKCLGNIDAYNNATQNQGDSGDCGRYWGPWGPGWSGCRPPCGRTGCGDGWRESWRR